MQIKLVTGHVPGLGTDLPSKVHCRGLGQVFLESVRGPRTERHPTQPGATTGLRRRLPYALALRWFLGKLFPYHQPEA